MVQLQNKDTECIGDKLTRSDKTYLAFFYHAGANCQYFETMLKHLRERDDFSYDIIRPLDIEKTDFSKYDVLVYQTFPDDMNRKKYNPASIWDLDGLVWHRFGGLKILLDSFDMGDRNGYKRFGIEWPRIKHVPSYEYLKRFNVISILCTTGWIQKPLTVIPVEIPRIIPIHCAFTVGVYPHKVRENIMDRLRCDYCPITSFRRIPVEKYNEFLRGVKISVVATGFGETSGSAYSALRAGTLLFVHENIQKVKLFPFVDLVNGEDYVSFNEKNFTGKLDWILKDYDRRDRIRLSGQRKFMKGFNVERSATEFLKYLSDYKDWKRR